MVMKTLLTLTSITVFTSILFAQTPPPLQDLTGINIINLQNRPCKSGFLSQETYDTSPPTVAYRTHGRIIAMGTISTGFWLDVDQDGEFEIHLTIPILKSTYPLPCDLANKVVPTIRQQITEQYGKMVIR